MKTILIFLILLMILFSITSVVLLVAAIAAYVYKTHFSKSIKLETTTVAVITLSGIALLVVLYGTFLISCNWPIDGISVSESGTFGDSFGFLSSMFSGLAFGGLIWTIMLQRQDLKVTKEEVAENRRILANQQFEKTFFDLLENHHRIVESTAIDYKSKEKVCGRASFKIINIELVEMFEAIKENEAQQNDIIISIQAYEEVHKAYRSALEHYFRNLYNMVKYIDMSELYEDDAKNFQEKKRFVDMLGAQLSTYELVLLFYNGLSKYGRRRAKPLIEKYSLLENMDEEALVSYDVIRAYDKTAYGTKPLQNLPKEASASQAG